MESSSPRTPWHVWFIGGLTLVWNSFGALDYLMTQTQNASYMSNFTQEQLEFFYGFPWWVTAAWAVAVWGSVAGSLALLFRRAVAVPLFAASLLAMTVTTFHNYVLEDAAAIMGGMGPLIFTVVIFLVAVGLFLYARRMRTVGVLR